MLHQRAERMGVRTKAVCLVLYQRLRKWGAGSGNVFSVTHRAGGLEGEG